MPHAVPIETSNVATETKFTNAGHVANTPVLSPGELCLRSTDQATERRQMTPD